MTVVDIHNWLLPIGSMYGIYANIGGYIDGKCYHI